MAGALFARGARYSPGGSVIRKGSALFAGRARTPDNRRESLVPGWPNRPIFVRSRKSRIPIFLSGQDLAPNLRIFGFFGFCVLFGAFLAFSSRFFCVPKGFSEDGVA
jgi:hypothetical protein